MSNFTPRLIPRKQFNAKRESETLDAYNLPTFTSTTFTIENAGLQPITGEDARATSEGYKDKEIYILYTTTELKGPEEGTSNRGDLVEIEAGKWARVLKVEPWQYGLQSHYKAKLVVENER